MDSVPDTSGTKIVIGKSSKEWITYDMNVSPHALVCGGTGSGKSVTMNNIVNEIRKKGWLIYFSDFKGGVEFGIYSDKGYKVITEREDFAKFSNELIGELEWRSKLIAQYRAKNLIQLNEKLIEDDKDELPRIVCVFDEYADINSIKDEASSIINSNIGRILAKGRAVGIHVVIGTQRPDAKTIGEGAFRDNISCRIVGKMESASASEMALGKGDISAFYKIPDDNRKKGMFICRGTGTVDRNVIIRTPYMNDKAYTDMILNEWPDNPYQDYELHFTDDISDSIVKDEYDEEITLSSKQNRKEREFDPLDLM